MNTLLRAIIYLVAGLVLVIVSEIVDARLGWSLDLAWLLIAAAAFAWPVEVAPLAGILFGLILDSLSGTGTLIYALSYGGFGLIMLLVRRAFYLGGIIPGWIMAVVGAELLWLFMGVFSQGIILLGGAARSPGWLSPFLLSTAVLYPLAYWVATRLLRHPVEAPRKTWYASPTRVLKT